MVRVRQKFISLLDKTVLACVGVGRVVSRWNYGLGAVVITLIFGIILTLSSNGTTDWNLLFSHLPLIDKIQLVGDVLGRLFTNVTSFTGAITLLVSVLQGLVIVTLIYNVRNQEKVSSNRIGESTLASLAMVIGLGCPSCGTSLLVPLLGVISSSLLSFLNAISVAIIVIALLVSIYTLWRVGYIAYAHTSAAEFNKKEGKK